MLHTVDVALNKFQVDLNHIWSLRPCRKTRHELDLKWTSRWNQSLPVLDKWKWITRHTQTKDRLQNCKCAQKHRCVHAEMETCLVCECQQCGTVLKDGAVQIKR